MIKTRSLISLHRHTVQETRTARSTLCQTREIRCFGRNNCWCCICDQRYEITFTCKWSHGNFAFYKSIQFRNTTLLFCMGENLLRRLCPKSRKVQSTLASKSTICRRRLCVAVAVDFLLSQKVAGGKKSTATNCRLRLQRQCERAMRRYIARGVAVRYFLRCGRSMESGHWWSVSQC